MSWYVLRLPPHRKRRAG